MRNSKTALFLMELIISILFFAMAGAVCVQLFVKAHLISNMSTQSNQAVLWAENIAEMYDRYDADASSIVSTLSEQGISAYLTYDTNPVAYNDFLPFSGLELYFDKSFQPSTSDNEENQFVLSLSIQKDSTLNLFSGQITVSRLQTKDSSAKELYSLTVDKYMAERRMH